MVSLYKHSLGAIGLGMISALALLSLAPTVQGGAVRLASVTPPPSVRESLPVATWVVEALTNPVAIRRKELIDHFIDSHGYTKVVYPREFHLLIQAKDARELGCTSDEMSRTAAYARERFRKHLGLQSEAEFEEYVAGAHPGYQTEARALIRQLCARKESLKVVATAPADSVPQTQSAPVR